MPSIDKKTLSERDICSKFITPAVIRAGWDALLQIREEVYFTKGRIIVRGKLVTRGKAKRADYILYFKPNIPWGSSKPRTTTTASATACNRPWTMPKRCTFPSSSPPTATASFSTIAPARAT